LPTCQRRNSPEEEPESKREQSTEVERQRTLKSLWASFIKYSNFPDCGKKALIFPSDHPETIDLPSLMKSMQAQVGAETEEAASYMRRSSF